MPTRDLHFSIVKLKPTADTQVNKYVLTLNETIPLDKDKLYCHKNVTLTNKTRFLTHANMKFPSSEFFLFFSPLRSGIYNCLGQNSLRGKGDVFESYNFQDITDFDLKILRLMLNFSDGLGNSESIPNAENKLLLPEIAIKLLLLNLKGTEVVSVGQNPNKFVFRFNYES